MTYKQRIVLFIVAVAVFGLCMTLTALAVGERWYIGLLMGFVSIIAVIMTCLGSEWFLVWVHVHENRK